MRHSFVRFILTVLIPFSARRLAASTVVRSHAAKASTMLAASSRALPPTPSEIWNALQVSREKLDWINL
jgi:hypothetical protein